VQYKSKLQKRQKLFLRQVVAQVVNKFILFYVNRKFIIAVKITRSWSISWPGCIHCISYHHVLSKIHVKIILPSMLMSSKWSHAFRCFDNIFYAFFLDIPCVLEK